MLEIVLLAMLVASWLYWLVALALVHFFFRSEPAHDDRFQPPVSILKPVKGVDAQAYENFISFCQQDYPEFELLFGVADLSDPVVPVIEQLQRDHPACSIRLVSGPAIGANAKASSLHHMVKEARHEVLVISDSDMRVTPDYLGRAVAPLADQQIGLVTCPYVGKDLTTLTARLEGLQMGVTFLPSVVVARKVLRMRFAMGATSVVRRGDLARIGGFAALADYLADDYELGARIAKLGRRVELSRYVVTSVLGATTFRDQWFRELRWQRCYRVSRPGEYPGLWLTFTTPLATALLVVSGFALYGWLMLAASLVLRWLVAWLVTRYTHDAEGRRWLALLPMRDMLSAVLWCLGAAGRRIVWRGQVYVLESAGRMRPAGIAEERVPEERRPWWFGPRP